MDDTVCLFIRETKDKWALKIKQLNIPLQKLLLQS